MYLPDMDFVVKEVDLPCQPRSDPPTACMKKIKLSKAASTFF